MFIERYRKTLSKQKGGIIREPLVPLKGLTANREHESINKVGDEIDQRGADDGCIKPETLVSAEAGDDAGNDCDDKQEQGQDREVIEIKAIFSGERTKHALHKVGHVFYSIVRYIYFIRPRAK